MALDYKMLIKARLQDSACNEPNRLLLSVLVIRNH